MFLEDVRSLLLKVDLQPVLGLEFFEGQFAIEIWLYIAFSEVVTPAFPSFDISTLHLFMSTGWTLASTLAYGMQCIPIADQMNKNKNKTPFYKSLM